MVLFRLFVVLTVASVISTAASPYSDPNLHEADFAVELDDCNTIQVHPRVLPGELNALNFFWTDEPGFDSHAGTFSAGSSIGFNILDALKKWNGRGFDTLDPSTQETLTVSFLFGTDFETRETHTGFVGGFDIPVAGDGSWHKHLGYMLNGAGPNDPDNGIYLLELQLYSTSEDHNIASSSAFWIVFNLSLPEQDHHNAIIWVDENLVQLPDLDQDNDVDLRDFAIFASRWLDSGCDCRNNWCDGADITQNGSVDFADLAKLTSNWLKSHDTG